MFPIVECSICKSWSLINLKKIKKRKAWKLKIRDGEGKFTWKWLDFKITALPSVPLVILFQKKEDEFWPTSKLQESRKLIGVVVVVKVEGLSHYNFNLVQLSEQFSFRLSAKKHDFLINSRLNQTQCHLL